jgi:phosphohistidine swiveling domain-containing protein
MSMQKDFISPDLKNINLEQWQFLGLWKQDVFSACFWQTCFDGNINQKLLTKFGFIAANKDLLIANGGNFFYNKEAMENTKKYAAGEIVKDNLNIFKSFAADAKATYLKGVAFAQQTAENAPLTLEYFNEFLTHGKKMTFYWWFSAGHLALSLESLLKEKIVEYKIPAQFVPALIPRFDTPLIGQQKELVGLKILVGGKTLKEIKKDEALFNRLEVCRKKYAWIEIANWIGEELTLDRLLVQIKNVQENFAEPAIDVPADVKKIAECLGCAGYGKQGGAEYLAMYEYLCLPYLQKLAKYFGLTYRELMTITHEEIRVALAGGNNNLKQIANSDSRKTMRWIIISTADGDMRFIDNEKDTALVDELIVPYVEMNIQEIKGEIGNHGKTIGIVKVIVNVDDFHKMEAGDVLVAPMTTPDFVVLMQKASAIITDIGGMLCHAAIVSRELNKPCITGTKIATQALHDGDEVEVDADHGVVKIIKRAKVLV